MSAGAIGATRRNEIFEKVEEKTGLSEERQMLITCIIYLACPIIMLLGILALAGVGGICQMGNIGGGCMLGGGLLILLAPYYFAGWVTGCKTHRLSWDG